MDLQLFARVLWRFRLIVLAGLVSACALALLSYMRIGFDGGKPSVTYRQSEEWVSYARLRFAWAVSRPPAEPSQDARAEADRLSAESLRQSRLVNYAILYARLVESDAVRKLMLRRGPIYGRIDAAPLPALEGSDEVLPIISIAGISSSPRRSLALTAQAERALYEYVERDQGAIQTPSERARLQVVNQPGQTKLLTPRSRTLPIVVFLSVMIATIALAFILENMRPRASSLPALDEARGSADTIRRSA